MVFDDFKPLKHLCTGCSKMTHSHKSIHNFYTDINSSFTMKN